MYSPLSIWLSLWHELLWSQLSGKLQLHFIKNKCTRYLKCVFILTHEKSETEHFPPPLAPAASTRTTCSGEMLTSEVLLLRQWHQWGLWGVLWTPDLRTYPKSYWNQPYHCKGNSINYIILSCLEGVGRCCLFPFLPILANITNTKIFSDIAPQLPRYISQANASCITETGRK